jgi:hypothetical protein
MCNAINRKEKVSIRDCGKGMISVEGTGKPTSGPKRPSVSVWIVYGLKPIATSL